MGAWSYPATGRKFGRVVQSAEITDQDDTRNRRFLIAQHHVRLILSAAGSVIGERLGHLPVLSRNPAAFDHQLSHRDSVIGCQIPTPKSTMVRALADEPRSGG